MNVFWQTPEPLTVSQLSRLLVGQDWSKNYIHKVLRWLSDKEFIKVVGIAQEGRYQAQQYVPTLTKDEYLAYMLEEQGVEIRTCGTCLNFYGISDKLQVGEVTNMYDIAERMTKADRIIKP